MEREFRYLITSVAGLIHVIEKTIHYKPFYTLGNVPDRFRDNPEALDRRIIDRYETDIPSWEASRRKAKGLANYKYVRYQDVWILFASQGDKRKMVVRNDVRDARQVPIRVFGYSIRLSMGGYEARTPKERAEAARGWAAYLKAAKEGGKVPKPPKPKRKQRPTASVRIEARVFEGLEAQAVRLARTARRDQVVAFLWNLPFESYAPVWQQKKRLVRRVNKILGARSMKALTYGVIKWKRTTPRPYDPVDGEPTPVAA